MFSILDVDDSAIDRMLVKRTLGDEFGPIDVAWSGDTALEKLDGSRFDLVITDMRMPDMNGLELMGEVHARYPDVPVILITGDGSEQLAVEALRRGAANYVRKDVIASELPGVCRTVLSNADHTRKVPDLSDAESGRLDFSIPSRRAAVSETVGRLREFAAAATGADGGTATRLGVALEEAALNAVIHGNLEVSSKLKNEDEEAFDKLIYQRERQAPYTDRVVRLWVEWNAEALTFGVRDEGPGFDMASLPDPLAPEQMTLNSGRGILLMRSFMETVEFRRGGREVVMGVTVGRARGERRRLKRAAVSPATDWSEDRVAGPAAAV